MFSSSKSSQGGQAGTPRWRVASAAVAAAAMLATAWCVLGNKHKKQPPKSPGQAVTKPSPAASSHLGRAAHGGRACTGVHGGGSAPPLKESSTQSGADRGDGLGPSLLDIHEEVEACCSEFKVTEEELRAFQPGKQHYPGCTNDTPQRYLDQTSCDCVGRRAQHVAWMQRMAAKSNSNRVILAATEEEEEEEEEEESEAEGEVASGCEEEEAS